MTQTPVPVTEAGSAVRLPPSPPIPKALQAVLAALFWRKTVARLTRRYGGAFTIEVPVFGTAVVITDPELIKQVYLADPADIGVRVPNQVTRVVGPGSVFGLNGAEHRRRRDLLSPIFHGKRLHDYEPMFTAEALAVITDWPDGQEFDSYPSLARIAINPILRTIFGAAGAELDELRQIIPAIVKLGARLAALPMPSRSYGRFSPWGRLARLRARYETVVDELIAQLHVDPNADTRTDVLAVLARTESDGTTRSGVSRTDIGDELLALVAASHENIAATLAWVFERISRHPQLLADLTAEADAGGNTLRRATINEVLRTRGLSGFHGRYVYAPACQLGEWTIPRGCVIRIVSSEVHGNPAIFPDPDRFDPQRFLDGRPSPFEWTPFGGGARRCPGSAFATLQIDVVLRTVLQHYMIQPTDAPGEKWHFRGVSFTAARGGRITVRRRGTERTSE